ncbi:hypothetical protein [Photorhabdus sp. SF281]|uniref:hypothetical protein n=1 Tax=Photorhabdus sp. SF281 TaxID=3459527 RepID=UPI004044222D
MLIEPGLMVFSRMSCPLAAAPLPKALSVGSPAARKLTAKDVHLRGLMMEMFYGYFYYSVWVFSEN